MHIFFFYFKKKSMKFFSVRHFSPFPCTITNTCSLNMESKLGIISREVNDLTVSGGRLPVLVGFIWLSLSIPAFDSLSCPNNEFFSVLISLHILSLTFSSQFLAELSTYIEIGKSSWINRIFFSNLEPLVKV